VTRGQDGPDAANRNQLWAAALLDELARSGVRHVVIAPGSRSTPLVLAAHRNPDLIVHVGLDERSAAFFALGIGRASGHPAAVITTSGTAVANLLPAAVEADRAEVPLLLLTADRPRELRDGDANQSVRQPGIFSTCARAEWDLMHPEVSTGAVTHLRAVACRAVAATRGSGAGPVHLNVPFRKPLEPTLVESDREAILALGAEVREVREGRPDGAPWVRIHDAVPFAAPTVVRDVAEALGEAERPLFVAGHLAPGCGDVVLRAAHAVGAPILADPLSGARFANVDGATRIVTYDTILRDEEIARALEPDLILRLGRTPTSAVTATWLAAGDARRIAIDAGPLWKDHSASVHDMVVADPVAFLSVLTREVGVSGHQTPDRSEWLRTWRDVEAAARTAFEGDLASIELAVARTVVRSAEDGDSIFVSSSMPIRDVDTVSGAGDRLVAIHANRGASGIDGVVSTALGAAASGSGPLVALLGDLAFLHDANGLALARAADVVFVVVNNDGGGIFHMLPVSEWDPPFTELFATPQGRDLATHSASFGLPHDVVSPEELDAALSAALAAGSTRVLEVRTDREREVDARATDRGAAVRAARSALGLPT